MSVAVIVVGLILTLRETVISDEKLKENCKDYCYFGLAFGAVVTAFAPVGEAVTDLKQYQKDKNNNIKYKGPRLRSGKNWKLISLFCTAKVETVLFMHSSRTHLSPQRYEQHSPHPVGRRNVSVAVLIRWISNMALLWLLVSLGISSQCRCSEEVCPGTSSPTAHSNLVERNPSAFTFTVVITAADNTETAPLTTGFTPTSSGTTAGTSAGCTAKVREIFDVDANLYTTFVVAMVLLLLRIVFVETPKPKPPEPNEDGEDGNEDDEAGSSGSGESGGCRCC